MGILRKLKNACVVVSLFCLVGCGVGLASIPKPPMPVAGERKVQAMFHPETNELGIWEPVWSEANGVIYTLSLELKARQDDLILDMRGK